jgi:hypothetical protein
MSQARPAQPAFNARRMMIHDGARGGKSLRPTSYLPPPTLSPQQAPRYATPVSFATSAAGYNGVASRRATPGWARSPSLPARRSEEDSRCARLCGIVRDRVVGMVPAGSLPDLSPCPSARIRLLARAPAGAGDAFAAWRPPDRSCWFSDPGPGGGDTRASSCWCGDYHGGRV